MAAKTEVYTWRLTAAIKARLEDAARINGQSVAHLLDELVAENVERAVRGETDAARQQRLHDRARRFVGGLSGGRARRSRRVRELVRARLKARQARAR